MKNIFKLSILAALLLVPAGLRAADDNGIVLDKTVKEKGNNVYTLTLETYAEGTTVKTVSVAPTDLVLVLDVSTSMASAQGSQYLLSDFVKLTTGDNIGILHTDVNEGTPKCNYAKVYDGRNDPASKKTTLRYRIKLSTSTTVRNLRYNNGNWYYSNNGTKTEWDDGKGWTKYTPNAADEILTDVKIDLLQEACRAFIRTIEDSAKGEDGKIGGGDDVDHRIGFATFCGSLTQWTNIVPVFTNVAVSTGGQMSMEAFVNQLHLHMGSNTAPSNAFNQAVKMYQTLNTTLTTEGKTNAEKDKRSKVTVMFTDGEPTNGVDTNIGAAVKLKSQFNDGYKKGSEKPENYGRLFTVGIFSDPTKTVDGVTIRNYMTYTSSDYQQATGSGRTERGSINTDGVEYYKESSGADLSAIFTEIASDIPSTNFDLNEETTIVMDALTNMFKLPKGASTSPSDIHIYTCAANPNNTSKTDPVWATTGTGGITVHKDADNNVVDNSVTGGHDEYWVPWTPWGNDTSKMGKYIIINGGSVDFEGETDYIEVTGYDFAGNFVGLDGDGKWKGEKFIIQFDITTDPANTGGVTLNTNDPRSGVYVKDENGYTPIENYISPTANLPYLRIFKKGLAAGQSAIFEVSGPQLTTTTVILSSKNGGNETPSAIVKLPAVDGTYTVKEIPDWSWEAPTVTVSSTENGTYTAYNATTGFKQTLTKPEGGWKSTNCYLDFYFKNSYSTSAVKHDETYVHNNLGTKEVTGHDITTTNNNN